MRRQSISRAAAAVLSALLAVAVPATTASAQVVARNPIGYMRPHFDLSKGSEVFAGLVRMEALHRVCRTALTRYPSGPERFIIQDDIEDFRLWNCLDDQRVKASPCIADRKDVQFAAIFMDRTLGPGAGVEGWVENYRADFARECPRPMPKPGAIRAGDRSLVRLCDSTNSFLLSRTIRATGDWGMFPHPRGGYRRPRCLERPDGSRYQDSRCLTEEQRDRMRRREPEEAWRWQAGTPADHYLCDVRRFSRNNLG